MRSSAKYATICSIIFATSSCDPAQRLQITNLTDNNIELQKQDLYPDFVGKIGNDSLNRIVIISPGDYFTEFYGIGGWWDNSEIQMKHHLDSIISVKVQGKFMTRVTLSEFGESLMTYEIRD